MNQLAIILPLPDKRLHPNSLVRNVVVRSKLKAKARRDAGYATMAVLREQTVTLASERLAVQAVFAFRTLRHHDEDNLTAWLKAYADGIADALKRNDRDFRWLPPLQRVDPLKQSVTITVSELTDEKPENEPF